MKLLYMGIENASKKNGRCHSGTGLCPSPRSPSSLKEDWINI